MLRSLSCVLLCLLSSENATAQSLSIAAASDLQFALQEVSGRFQKETSKSVALTFGSSGNFFSQIQNGAPFDLFFSADIEYPKRLESAGLTESGSLYRYATGKIVLWVTTDSPLDVSHGLDVLTDSRINKIAIANPQHAPYGRAAVAALQHEKLYEKVRDKFVLGEDISQTAQFVDSGNAEIGILAFSLASAPSLKTRGRFYEIPTSYYPPIDQAAVILKSSANKGLAQQFLTFLKRPDIVLLMQKYGFVISTGPAN